MITTKHSFRTDTPANIDTARSYFPDIDPQPTDILIREKLQRAHSASLSPLQGHYIRAVLLQPRAVHAWEAKT